MVYPFRFALHERVTVIDGERAGRKGIITALELTATKTVAVVEELDHPKAKWREHEGNLRREA